MPDWVRDSGLGTSYWTGNVDVGDICAAGSDDDGEGELNGQGRRGRDPGLRLTFISEHRTLELPYTI